MTGASIMYISAREFSFNFLSYTTKRACLPYFPPLKNQPMIQWWRKWINGINYNIYKNKEDGALTWGKTKYHYYKRQQTQSIKTSQNTKIMFSQPADVTILSRTYKKEFTKNHLKRLTFHGFLVTYFGNWWHIWCPGRIIIV